MSPRARRTRSSGPTAPARPPSSTSSREPCAPTPGPSASRARTSPACRRPLEVSMSLATRPLLLLLDEPMAGMGHDESQRMIGLLSSLKRRQTIVLVEHDMDAVFRLADRIAVLVYGRVIASDSPKKIKMNEEVRRTYLGEEA